jgi:hypothetical protein
MCPSKAVPGASPQFGLFVSKSAAKDSVDKMLGVVRPLGGNQNEAY